ncbi:MAG: hypothetical protein JNJ59_23815 [Deltaproteobacteria bacterium]|nr:hypothetical protein [Deltaproteobacteria bacterium]
MTSQGCTACGDIDALVQERLEAAALAVGTCEIDDDCERVTRRMRCGTFCDLAIPATARDAFEAAAAAIDPADCGSLDSVWCRTQGRCSQDGTPRCVAGACRVVRPCDPVQAPVGTACDDGDPCTVEDTCTTAFVCTGRARDCDDQNACTQDSCESDGTCLSAPLSALCDPPEGSCAVGAECQGGACTESEVLGFTQTYAKPWRYAQAVTSLFDRDDAAIFVGGYQGQESPWTAFLLVLDAQGVPTRSLTLAAPGAVTDLEGLADGGVLVAALTVGFDVGVRVTRLSATFGETWHVSFGSSSSPWSPRLAVAAPPTSNGAGVPLVAVAWYDAGDLGLGLPRVALLDLDGHVRAEVSVSTALGRSKQGAPYVTPLDAADGSVFVTAHTRTDLDTDHSEVLLTRIAADGRLLGQTPIPTDRDEDARGLTGLPDGGVLVWGVHLIGSPSQPGTRDGAGWLRRVSASGEVLYELPLNIAAAFVRDDHLELVGADPIPGADFEIGTRAWLGRLDLDVLSTPSPTRWDMPPGPAIRAAAPLHTGVVLLGNLWDRDPLLNPLGDGSNAAAWVRRAALELPSCDPRP